MEFLWIPQSRNSLAEATGWAKLRVFCGVWNLHGKSPPEELRVTIWHPSQQALLNDNHQLD
eukprot:1313207-Amphidinium_carterae.1